MGQGQSRNSSAAADEAPQKEDYYDLLGVERTASDDELKKAYRRKALELHPDRNYGNVEHATRLFAETQTAYEVLSDPQERAWYDSHRDVLLRGDQAGKDGEEFSYNVRVTTAIEVQQLMLSFNGKVKFSDAPSGFYGGLNDFFKQLAKEENIACQWEDEEPMDYPDFGSKDDSYEDVVRPFYSAWTGFATRKSYSWKDQYRLSDAPDRRIRRLMEKENKKLREEAIQEFNDAVRSLIAFVRKRDPRVANNQKSEAERQKILRDAAAAQRARSQAARQAQLKEFDTTSAIPAWAQSRTKDEHEGGFSSESDIEDHEYDCVVCDKTFKSEAQFHAHQKSKKHIKLLKQLKRDMRGQDEDLDPEPGKTPSEEVKIDAHDHNESHPESDKDPEAGHAENGVPDDSDVEEEKGVGVTHGAAVNGTHNHTQDSTPINDSDDDDDDYASREQIEKRLGAGATDDLGSQLEGTILDGTPATSDTESTSAPQSKLGKAKQKRAKKAAQQAFQVAPQQASEFRCVVCKADFSSKTKLFNHLNEKPSHAAPISQTKAAKGGKGKKR